MAGFSPWHRRPTGDFGQRPHFKKYALGISVAHKICHIGDRGYSQLNTQLSEAPIRTNA